jgi:ribokinase
MVKIMGKITVFGSFVTDLMFRVPNLPIKGETLKASTFKLGPGGKGANQAVAAKRAGADVVMITKIGKDPFGEIALNNFKKEQIDIEFIYQDEDHPTAVASILVDEKTGDNQIAIAMGAGEQITLEEVEKARESIESADVLVTQLEVNLDATEMAIDIAKEKGVKIILNPAPAQPLSDEFLQKVDILTPNETEASILCGGLEVVTVEDAKKAAKVLLNKGVKNVIITLGEKGALLLNDEVEKFVEALKVDVIDTTGAGDAYNGGLAAALAEGKDIIEATKFANIVGALSVTKIGTAPAMPYRADIDKLL